MDKPVEPDFVRRTLRVIRMVSELHRKGYQHIRFMPYEYPLAFRVAIAPAALFSPLNGIELVDFSEGRSVQYSSASKTDYFGWRDARTDSARELAGKFIQRFPLICEEGRGRDWAYAGWLHELIGSLERTSGALPLVMDEFTYKPSELRSLPFRNYALHRDTIDAFPLPPGRSE